MVGWGEVPAIILKVPPYLGVDDEAEAAVGVEEGIPGVVIATLFEQAVKAATAITVPPPTRNSRLVSNPLLV
jgi:hypothetical protein